MLETSEKLAFIHPIVVLKSGLKHNWMKKLDHVNGPQDLFQFIGCIKMFVLGVSSMYN